MASSAPFPREYRICNLVASSVALAWPNGSGPSPIAHAQWGNANRRGRCAQRTNAGMRMAPRPPNRQPPLYRIGKLLPELPPTTHPRQYGVGRSRGFIASSLDRAENRLRMEDQYRTARPPQRASWKQDGEGAMSTVPEFNDFPVAHFQFISK